MVRGEKMGIAQNCTVSGATKIINLLAARGLWGMESGADPTIGERKCPRSLTNANKPQAKGRGMNGPSP